MQAVRRKNLPRLIGMLLVFMLVLTACGEPALTEESLHSEGDSHAVEEGDAHDEQTDDHAAAEDEHTAEGAAAEEDAAHSEEAEGEAADDHAEEGEAQMAEETQSEEEASTEEPTAAADEGDAEAMAHGSEGEMAEGEHMEDMEHAHMDVPEEFAELENPYAGSEDAAAEGGKIFATACTVCHGEKGEGDGPGAAGLDPKPANLSDAVMMAELSDAFLFWRITKGGAMEPFNSAMPSWEAAYTEQQRWQLVTYVRALSQ